MNEGAGAKLVRALSDVLEEHGASSSEGLEALVYLVARTLQHEPKPSIEAQAASAFGVAVKILQITEHLSGGGCHMLSWQPTSDKAPAANPTD